MTTSTRRTFTAGKDPRNARPSITERVLGNVARRGLKQVQAAGQQPTQALAAPGGLVQRPGGEPLRPRATQATGATPVGGAVGYSQGILTGQPLIGQGQRPGPGFNGQEAIDVAIEQPEDGREYLISAYEFFRSQVVQIISSDVGVVATLTPGPGEVAEVGESLVLTLDTVPDGLETVTVSIELRRL